MKVLFLPLDSRQITYEEPFLIGKYSDFEVIRPELKIMDFYKQASNYEDIKKWLLENISDCDYAIISVEQLVYGSLLASRSMDIDLDKALERLNVIKELKKIQPDIKIILSNVLMRSTISTLNKDDEVWWKKIAEYSSLLSSDYDKAKKLENEIPENILNTFLFSRKRNHEINLSCIELLKKQYCDELIIVQEDSSMQGIHKLEQEQLLNKIEEYNLKDKFYLMNGTDELASCLMGRLNNESGFNCYVDWYYDNYEKLICLFEDRPFKENLDKYFALCNIFESSIDDSDYILSIYYPYDLNPGDYCSDYIAKNCDEELEKYVNHLKSLLLNGKKICLLDIYNSNGGSPDLIKKLHEQEILDKLYVYSAWNTASNSLGTLIGEMLMKKKNDDLFYRHILDDMFYQAMVRKEIDDYLDSVNIDNWNIENVDEISKMINDLMHEKVKEFKLDIPKEYDVSLWWPRTFECLIKYEGDD